MPPDVRRAALPDGPEVAKKRAASRDDARHVEEEGRRYGRRAAGEGRGGAMTRAALTWDQLPLYAKDEELGEAVLGRERKREFSALAQLYERDGMPKICPVWGGRYVLSVKAFFDAQNGLSAAVPLAANGVEGDFHGRK